MVVFTLHHILWTSIVKAEDLIVQVQAVGIDRKAPGQFVGCLRIELEVRVEVVIACRASCISYLWVRYGC